MLTSNQHGFVPRKSTLTNMLYFLDIVSAAMNDGYSMDVLYLDIAKAFDTIPFDRLLDCLNKYGMNETVFNWLKEFLFGRTQHVALGGQLSKPVDVTSGVPQGSVLGPLLFLMFFERIRVDHPCNLVKYADDCKIFCNDPLVLQQQVLDAVFDIESSGLRIAAEKSSLLRISTVGTETVPEYFVNGNAVPSVTSQRDLGTVIDTKLKFSDHCQAISSKALALCYRIRHSFFSKEPEFLFKIFKIYVRPILEHDSCVWSPYLKKDILKVEKP